MFAPLPRGCLLLLFRAAAPCPSFSFFRTPVRNERSPELGGEEPGTAARGDV